MAFRNILITRQPEQSVDFVNLLSRNLFYPFLLPMIETSGLNFNVRKKVYDFIIFSSINAVKYFMDKSDARAIKYIAVGSKTAEFLKNYGIDAIVPQGEFSADGLIDYFKNIDVKDKNILIPVPETHSDKFKNYLITNGALVETVVIYKTSKIKYEEGYVKNFIAENKIDTVVFASPSAAESFFMNFHEDSFINKLNFISIGKTTYNFLKNSLNIDSYYPEEYTIYGVVLLLQELRRTK